MEQNSNSPVTTADSLKSEDTLNIQVSMPSIKKTTSMLTAQSSAMAVRKAQKIRDSLGGFPCQES